jgi:hypothetical protein
MRRSKGTNVELTREPHEVALETWDNLTNQIAPVRNLLSPTTVDTSFLPREMHKVENDLENDDKDPPFRPLWITRLETEEQINTQISLVYIGLYVHNRCSSFIT